MVNQVQLNLNVPLDVEAETTLSQTNLLPQFSTASTVLHGDYYTQQQSKLNQFILKHWLCKSFIIVTVGATLTYKLWDYIMVSSSILEFLEYSITRDFIFEVIGAFPSLMLVAGLIGVITYVISDDLKDVSKKLIIDNYIGDIFGFNIVEFAKLDKDDGKLSTKDIQLLKHGDNTHLLIYRNSPIAIVTIVPEFKDDKFVVKISGIHVRKVFANVDFEEMLLEWSILRSRQVLQDYLQDKKITNTHPTIEIQIDCFNWDRKLINLLNQYQFEKVEETYKLNQFSITDVPGWQLLLNQFFDIKRLSYQLNIATGKEDEQILSENPTATEFVEPKKETTSVRRRK